MLSPCSKLPSVCLQPPTVVPCISLHKRRGCLGAATPVPAGEDSSIMRSDSILPLILPFLSENLFKRNFLSLVLITHLELCADDPREGKSYSGGGCDGMISCLSWFASAHIFSVDSWGESGHRGSKYTLIPQCLG